MGGREAPMKITRSFESEHFRIEIVVTSMTVEAHSFLSDDKDELTTLFGQVAEFENGVLEERLQRHERVDA